MKTLSKILFFALFAGSLTIYMTSCSELDSVDNISTNNTDAVYLESEKPEIMTIDEIDDFLVEKIESSSQQFEWRDIPLKLTYSALMLSDSIISVSYLPDGYNSRKEFYSSPKIKQAYQSNGGKLPDICIKKRDDIINIVLEEERAFRKNSNLTKIDIIPVEYSEKLPYIHIKVTSPNAIDILKRNKSITAFSPHNDSHLLKNYYRSVEWIYNTWPGCIPNAAEDVIPDENYYALEGNSLISWNYPDNGIYQAWTAPWQSASPPPGNPKGEGIKVCVIDSGISENQPNLGAEFTTGLSSGRNNVQTFSTFVENCPNGVLSTTPYGFCQDLNVYDICGHGTAMAGVIAAPAAGDFNMVGIAYKADLTTIRVANNVWINTLKERIALTNALTIAASNPDIKIISISLGSFTPDVVITETLNQASLMMDKLIFCAVGTTNTNREIVMFPASLPTEVTIAMTGVKRELDGNGRTVLCKTCHFGEEVDFSTIMEKGTGDERVGPLTLPMTPAPSDLNRPKYTNGSSSATATAAGIAALVWAAHPNETKDDIFERLEISAIQNTPIPGQNHGIGVLNAEIAINAEL